MNPRISPARNIRWEGTSFSSSSGACFKGRLSGNKYTGSIPISFVTSHSFTKKFETN